MNWKPKKPRPKPKSMKNLLFISIISLVLFFGVSNVYSQDITLPRDVAETALKAMELVPAYENKIKALEVTVSELKAQQKTPCSIAMESVKGTLLQFELLDTSKLSPEDAKQARKLREKTYGFLKKNSSRVLQSQCGYTVQNKWEMVLKQLLPLSYLFLKV